MSVRKESQLANKSLANYCLVIICLCLGHVAAFTQIRNCEVVGHLTDLQGVGIANSKVSYRALRGQIVKSGESDANGRYSIELPPGTYEVFVNRGAYPARYKRANVTLACNAKPMVNIYLLPECVSFGCKKGGFSFATFGLAWTKNRVNNLVIAFNNRKNAGSKIVYEDAVLTYDLYTIRGDRITQDLSTGMIMIAGSAWLDDGTNKRDFRKLLVNFVNNGIQLTY